jgi:hypothetical protein
MIESPMRDYGKINAWELCTYEEYGGVQISPSDVDCFLHLLFSNSSESIEFLETHTRPDWGATLRLWGPLRTKPSARRRRHLGCTRISGCGAVGCTTSLP